MKTALKKTTLGQQMANILRERIIIEQYGKGERLAEEDLANEFDVSRASVREALRILESEGMLVREINKYTYVRTFSKKEIKALFSVRALLEKQSVKYCLENNCVPEEELRIYLEEMNISDKKGPDAWNEYLRADINFHLAIIKAMDNPYITEFWQRLQSQYLMVVYMMRDINPLAFFGGSELHKKMLEQLTLKNGEPWFKHLDMVEEDVRALTKQIE